MRIVLFVLIFCSLGQACSQKTNRLHQSIKYSSVLSTDKEEGKSVPSIDKKKFNVFDNEVIGDRTLNNANEGRRSIVTGVLFGPGLYRSLNFLNILKIFEENEISVHILSGIGMGAIIASLYANGKTPELIEWKFYKLFSNLKREKAHSLAWRDMVHGFLVKEFGRVRMENLEISLVIPVYDYKEKRIIYKRRGQLVDIIMSNFQLEKQAISERYLSPLIGSFIDIESFSFMGIDKMFVFDVLGDNISFINPDDFVFGLYARASGYLKNYKSNDMINVLYLPNGNISLDDYQFGQNFTMRSRDFLSSKIIEMQEFARAKE